MKQLEDVMNKEVTRKEFLATLGFGIASILGFSGVVKFLFGKGSSAQRSGGTYGYGGGVYGGSRHKA
ncbi:MAG TPA: hypothetical protein VLG16_00830 [Candidatus Saccharimonadales bacterium]|nr:hypothetical protein [Candidatus Saccharimonadales bacterium]